MKEGAAKRAVESESTEMRLDLDEVMMVKMLRSEFMESEEQDRVEKESRGA